MYPFFCREEQAEKRQTGEKSRRSSASRVERESHMPAYAASIGDGLDGTFDDFLELALQFGVVTMFAGAFPLVALFALVNNLVEIRSDSFKLACTMRRPVPHRVASIGAWLNIFQVIFRKQMFFLSSLTCTECTCFVQVQCERFSNLKTSSRYTVKSLSDVDSFQVRISKRW